MEKAIRAGSVLLGSKRNSSMWMWFLPQLRLPRRYAFRYVMIEVLDISSKFDLVVEDAFFKPLFLLRKTRSFPDLRRRIISWQNGSDRMQNPSQLYAAGV